MLIMTARSSALIGMALAVPIGLLFAAVILDLEPLGALLRSILPLAMAVTSWPMIRREVDGRRRVYAANLAVAAFVGVLMLVTWGALLEEIVRCDVMGIPNCD